MTFLVINPLDACQIHKTVKFKQVTVMVAYQKKCWRQILIVRAAITLTCYCIIKITDPYILPSAQATSASVASRTLAGNGNVNHRLPRTSASQHSSGTSAPTSFKLAAKPINTTRHVNLRLR